MSATLICTEAAAGAIVRDRTGEAEKATGWIISESMTLTGGLRGAAEQAEREQGHIRRLRPAGAAQERNGEASWRRRRGAP